MEKGVVGLSEASCNKEWSGYKVTKKRSPRTRRSGDSRLRESEGRRKIEGGLEGGG